MGDAAAGVGCGDKKDVAEVVVDFEIVIVEGFVLFGVEDFKECACGVAAEVGRHFVDFIQQNDGVYGFGFFHGLDDFAGEGAYVGTAVATDFGFVAYAAEADSDEFASEGVCDAFGEGGFSDAWGTDEAEDAAADVFCELMDGEVFDYAVFDFFEAVVVAVEDFLGGFQVAFIAGGFAPWEIEQPFDVCAGNGGLGRHGGHLCQAVEFAGGFLAGFVAHFAAVDFVGEFFDFHIVVAAEAEFFFDNLELFVEEVFFLAFADLGSDLRHDLVFEFEELVFHGEELAEKYEFMVEILGFQKLLFVAGFEVGVVADGVYDLDGVFVVAYGGEELFRDFVVEAHVGFELIEDEADLGFQAGVFGGFGGEGHDEGACNFLVLFEAEEAGYLLAFDEDLGGSVGHFENLEDFGDGAVLIKVGGCR